MGFSPCLPCKQDLGEAPSEYDYRYCRKCIVNTSNHLSICSTPQQADSEVLCVTYVLAQAYPQTHVFTVFCVDITAFAFLQSSQGLSD